MYLHTAPLLPCTCVWSEVELAASLVNLMWRRHSGAALRLCWLWLAEALHAWLQQWAAANCYCWCVDLCRVPFAIGVFSPSGYIDTLYLDEDLRISKGEHAGTAVDTVLSCLMSFANA